PEPRELESRMMRKSLSGSEGDRRKGSNDLAPASGSSWLYGTKLTKNGCSMIQRQLKLRLNTRQEGQLTDWLYHLTGVWNWAIRKIELDAKDGIFYTP